jgi:hypothetical protein
MASKLFDLEIRRAGELTEKRDDPTRSGDVS